jgi:hypothetical protein
MVICAGIGYVLIRLDFFDFLPAPKLDGGDLGRNGKCVSGETGNLDAPITFRPKTS